jgi:hypothetical protein
LNGNHPLICPRQGALSSLGAVPGEVS